MRPKSRNPKRPGNLLRHELLESLRRTQVALVEHLGIAVQRINEIVRGERGIPPGTASVLPQARGTFPELWLNQQAAHDLARHRSSRPPRLRQAS
jgi:antitoxin HigA-1